MRAAFALRCCISLTIRFAEKFDNAGTGKYTAGLGQQNMAFVNDREDINSICLTGSCFAFFFLMIIAPLTHSL